MNFVQLIILCSIGIPLLSLWINLVGYVHDIVIIGNDQDDITWLKKYLFQHFRNRIFVDWSIF